MAVGHVFEGIGLSSGGSDSVRELPVISLFLTHTEKSRIKAGDLARLKKTPCISPCSQEIYNSSWRWFGQKTASMLLC